MSAPAEFLLPDLGEGLTEAELLSWSVAVGDTVELDQPLCEVETAKAVVELPAPFAGTVAALHAEPGATVVVGEKLVTIDDGGGSGTASSDAGLEVAADDAARPDSSATGEPPAAARADDAAPPTLVGSGPLPHRPGRAGWRRRSHGTPATSAGAGTGADTDAAGAIRAKPSARKAARERGVDITAVRPARADGVITEADVARRAGAGRDGIRTPADAFRRATAAAVSASARSVPHATAFRTADFTSAMSLLRRLRGDGADGEDRTEVRLSPLTLVAKAVLVALVRHPSSTRPGPRTPQTSSSIPG